MKRLKQIIALLMVMILAVPVLGKPEKVHAAVKKISIVAADQNGKYSFYDINSSENKTAGIEITNSGSIMVPLKKLSSLMPALAFSYDTKTKKYTVTNKVNGKKAVFTKDTNTVYYYANAKAKGVKKTLPSKTYISAVSSALMVHMSALKWVMQETSGVKSFKVSEMQSAGYDTYTYSGLIAYNPYGTISSIPKATNVANLSSTIRVTIPEGYSIPQIFDLLVKKGVCASTDFLYSAMDGEPATEFAEEIPFNENRCFKLEGYLFPDTYEFYRLSKGTDVINRILKNTESRITPEDRAKAESLGYTVDEILTIASLIEKEAPDADTMSKVSSVIHNRLNIKMKLQLDATDFYLQRYIRPNITGDTERFNIYYDTYQCSALPAGPVCSPGKAAIKAALNPADTDYLYFYSDAQKNYYFTVTYEEIKAISGK